MRKHWLATWMLVAAATGCAMPGMGGSAYRTAQQDRPQQQIMAKKAPPVKQASFTEQLTGMIPGMSSKKPEAQLVKAPANHQNDPISLGFGKQKPTPDLFLSMAKLSDQAGNVQHARSMYQRALSMEPNNRDALLGLARLEDREGRFNIAVQIYRRTASMYPQDAQVLNDLALCHARQGQLVPSLQLLDRVVHLKPEKALYRNNIAKVLVEMNRVEDAVTHLAVVHPPAVAQYNMAVLLQQRGRNAEAVRFLTAATHIDPRFQAARNLLVQLQGSAPSQLANDGVLPTPMARTASASSAHGTPYPSTGMTSQRPLPVAFPAESAQVPAGTSPALLPPVR